jgi:hypothetical protein
VKQGRPARRLRGGDRRGQPGRDALLGRSRLYLSENGGIFWRALVPELPEIEAVTFP